MFAKVAIWMMLVGAVFGEKYFETLYPEWGQYFEVGEMIHQEKSDYWDLAIFQNDRFGRVFAIDGAIQSTEADEAIYHEMMVHVPMLAHGAVKSVLIVGGGDGGALKQVLRHNGVEKAVLVEIDPAVIELSKKYLPKWSDGSFENQKTKIVIQDAAKYVKETEESFDLIICDSNDPEGPAKVLFSSEFYGDCKKRLNNGGIFVNQNGVPVMQAPELKLTLTNREPHFKHVTFFVAPVPSYVGGFLALGWASDETFTFSKKILKERMKNVTGKMFYYTPEIHKASFALPQYILDAIK